MDKMGDTGDDRREDERGVSKGLKVQSGGARDIEIWKLPQALTLLRVGSGDRRGVVETF